MGRPKGSKNRKPLDQEEDFPVPAKQERLAGMEDAGIEELEREARKYAGIRDKRMRLSTAEKDQKELVHALMKKYEKRGYRHNGVEVEIVVESETVKVKILSPEEAERESVRDNSNPGGANSESTFAAPSGDEEQPEVAGEGTEADSETSAVGTAGSDTENDPPF